MSPTSQALSAGRQDSTSKSLSTWQDEQKLVVHGQTLLELQAKLETMERSFKQKVGRGERLRDLTLTHRHPKTAHTYTHIQTAGQARDYGEELQAEGR